MLGSPGVFGSGGECCAQSKAPKTAKNKVRRSMTAIITGYGRS